MSLMLGYMLGYNAGESDAEVTRQRHEIVDRVLYGRRPVQVDQSYLDQLYQLIERVRSDSVYNYDKGAMFYREALDWKAQAQHHERRAADLEAQVVALQAQLAANLAHADARVAAERAVHQTTHDQKCGLDLFRLMATWLIDVHIAGRSDRPEFAELRDIAKDISDSIERGETFRGYRDEPEKMARLNRLLAALYRP
jgi:hypothetical protein